MISHPEKYAKRIVRDLHILLPTAFTHNEVAIVTHQSSMKAPERVRETKEFQEWLVKTVKQIWENYHGPAQVSDKSPDQESPDGAVVSPATSD